MFPALTLVYAVLLKILSLQLKFHGTCHLFMNIGYLIFFRFLCKRGFSAKKHLQMPNIDDCYILKNKKNSRKFKL